MRDDWSRSTPILDLGLAELTTLIQPAFPGQTVVTSEPTQGGLANTNIRVQLSETEEPLLVRLYVRNPAEGHKEDSLHRLVAASVPVPHCFYFAEHNAITKHPYALLEWIAGDRLEVVAPKLPTAQLVTLGHSIGSVLAAIHTITFPQTGFFAANLDIAQPISVGGAALLAYLRMCLIDGRGAERLGTELTDAVLAFVAREGDLLDSWHGPPCLVHGDFGGSNILVSPTSTEWKVAAVLDWEFAFSGSPFFDFGNLLRSPLGSLKGFEQAVYDGYVAAGGVLPKEWRQMSRLIDLTAWADFLNRPHTNAAIIRDARAIITRTITI